MRNSAIYITVYLVHSQAMRGAVHSLDVIDRLVCLPCAGSSGTMSEIWMSEHGKMFLLYRICNN